MLEEQMSVSTDKNLQLFYHWHMRMSKIKYLILKQKCYYVSDVDSLRKGCLQMQQCSHWYAFKFFT